MEKQKNINTRRDNGAGTIVKRKDGRWMGVVQIGTKPNGSPKKIYVYGSTEQEAKRKLKQKISEHNSLKGISIESTSVKTWFTDWLENTMKYSLSRKSYEVKKRAIEKFIIPAIGGMKISEVTSKDVQALINDMVIRNFSLSQIQKVYFTIGQRYKQGIIDQEVLYNPRLGAKLPSKKNIKSSSDDIKYLSKSELYRLKERLYEKYPNGTPIYRNADLIMILVYTGMRIGEALALTWEDIDFHNNLININKNIVVAANEDKNYINPKTNKPYVNKKYEQNGAKTSSGTRSIPISDACLSALKNIKLINGNSKWVYATTNGKIGDGSTLNRTLKSALKQAGLSSEYSLHSLRHTFATQLFENGVDVKIVSKLLGHSSVSITYDIYVHVIKDLEIQAIGKVTNFLIDEN